MSKVEARPYPSANKRVRLAYLVSHPIQYQAPLLRRIAQQPDIDLTVLFGSDFSVRGYRDQGFGVGVKWDVPLLDGYKHVFLPRLRDGQDVSSGISVQLSFDSFSITATAYRDLTPDAPDAPEAPGITRNRLTVPDQS